jgi:hypothetical protein
MVPYNRTVLYRRYSTTNGTRPCTGSVLTVPTPCTVSLVNLRTVNVIWDCQMHDDEERRWRPPSFCHSRSSRPHMHIVQHEYKNSFGWRYPGCLRRVSPIPCHCHQANLDFPPSHVPWASYQVSSNSVSIGLHGLVMYIVWINIMTVDKWTTSPSFGTDREPGIGHILYFISSGCGEIHIIILNFRVIAPMSRLLKRVFPFISSSQAIRFGWLVVYLPLGSFAYHRRKGCPR